MAKKMLYLQISATETNKNILFSVLFRFYKKEVFTQNKHIMKEIKIT